MGNIFLNEVIVYNVYQIFFTAGNGIPVRSIGIGEESSFYSFYIKYPNGIPILLRIKSTGIVKVIFYKLADSIIYSGFSPIESMVVGCSNKIKTCVLYSGDKFIGGIKQRIS